MWGEICGLYAILVGHQGKGLILCTTAQELYEPTGISAGWAEDWEG